MKPGRYAASDGSFAKSAGGAGARGLALLAVALLIGIALLNATDADPPGSTVSAGGQDSAGGSDGGGDDDGSGSPTTTAPAATTSPTVAARAPKDVKVIVANASSTKGAAGTASDRLKPLGYNVLAPANATAVNDSSVYFVAGFDREAAVIAAALQLPPTSVKAVPTPPPFDTKGANVAVVIGAADSAKYAAAGTTSTTAAGATTSSTASTSTTKKP
jgi:hypothetical protein